MTILISVLNNIRKGKILLLTVIIELFFNSMRTHILIPKSNLKPCDEY